jgi:putative sigma-54 modulation protein
MEYHVTGHNVEVTRALRDYALEKIRKLERFIHEPSEATVTLSVEKYRHQAEILLKVNGAPFQAHGESPDMYQTLDEVIGKLEWQLKKYKEKQMKRKQKHRKDERVAT